MTSSPPPSLGCALTSPPWVRATARTDDRYTYATAYAVRQWQKDLGLEQTGIIELGRIVFASSDIRIDTVEAALGDSAGPAGPFPDGLVEVSGGGIAEGMEVGMPS